MTDRDRLIELLKPHVSGTACLCESGSCELTSCRDCKARRLADYLLANGVIVPPCKVGQTVYIPVANTILHTKVFAFGVDEDGNKVINPKEYPEGVFSISGYEIGKTVFLTKEEAEERLKELKKCDH